MDTLFDMFISGISSGHITFGKPCISAIHLILYYNNSFSKQIVENVSTNFMAASQKVRCYDLQFNLLGYYVDYAF